MFIFVFKKLCMKFKNLHNCQMELSSLSTLSEFGGESQEIEATILIPRSTKINLFLFPAADNQESVAVSHISFV